MTETTRHTRARLGGIAAIAIVALMAAACSSLTPGRYPAGTYDVDVSLPAQSLTFEDENCSASISTPVTPLPGATVTVPAFSIPSGATSVTIDDVQVYIPGATIDGGTVDWVCDGTVIDQVTFSISFEGTVDAATGTLDTGTKTVTLTDATVDLANATMTIEGYPPLPLPATTVTIPTIELDY